MTQRFMATDFNISPTDQHKDPIIGCFRVDHTNRVCARTLRTNMPVSSRPYILENVARNPDASTETIIYVGHVGEWTGVCIQRRW